MKEQKLKTVVDSDKKVGSPFSSPLVTYVPVKEEIGDNEEKVSHVVNEVKG